MGEGNFHPQLTGTYLRVAESEVQAPGIRLRTRTALPESVFVTMRMGEAAGRLIPVLQIATGQKSFSFDIGKVLNCTLVNDSAVGVRQVCVPTPNPIFQFREHLGALEGGCFADFEYRMRISWNVDLSKLTAGYSLSELTRTGTPVTISREDYANIQATPEAQAEIRTVIERDKAMMVTFDVTKERVQHNFSGCTRMTPPSILNAVPGHWKITYRNATPWQYQSHSLTTREAIREGNTFFTESSAFANQMPVFFADLLTP